MGWTNIKDERPKPNSEVVVFYLVTINGSNFYAAEFVNEGTVDGLRVLEGCDYESDNSEVYWIEPPKERKEWVYAT